MIIQWHGQSCFKIQSGDLVLVIDPYSKELGLTPPRYRTDIVLVTHNHYDHSNLSSLGGEPFLISGPGEYETKGVYIHGIPSFHDSVQGKERGVNTIYVVEIDGVCIAHLGDFGEGPLRDETLDSIGDVDILMIPVGGKYTIDGEDAGKVVKQIEPTIVIPMHYKIPGIGVALDPVDQFLKEMGAQKTDPQEKLVIKKKDIIEDEKIEVVVLKVV